MSNPWLPLAIVGLDIRIKCLGLASCVLLPIVLFKGGLLQTGFFCQSTFLTDKKKKPDCFGNISLPNTWSCMDVNTMVEEDGWMDTLGTTSKPGVRERSDMVL